MLTLIIDDGVRSRGHRKNIFNPKFNYAGAALSPHARCRTVRSIDFAGGYAQAGRAACRAELERDPSVAVARKRPLVISRPTA